MPNKSQIKDSKVAVFYKNTNKKLVIPLNSHSAYNGVCFYQEYTRT